MVSVAFYGLRTNAHQLLAGAGASAFRRRLKVDSLLHDEIVMEAGAYEVLAGQGHRVERYFAEPEADRMRRQSPFDRRPRGTFRALLWFQGQDEATFGDAAMHTYAFDDIGLDRPSLQLRWRTTFLPLKAEVADADWIRWEVTTEPDSDRRDAIAEMARDDTEDPVLTARWIDYAARVALARSTVFDLLRISDTGYTLSADPLHATRLYRRVARGQAHGLFGRLALEVIEPRELTWPEVGELRKEPGLVEFRTILRDIEAEARDEATSLVDIEHRILRGYGDALARAEGRMPSRRAHAAVAAVGFIVGETAGMIAGVPLVGGLAGAGAGELATRAVESRARPRWLAVHRQLRQQHERR